MFPLVAVATALIPDLIKTIAGDRLGSVAGQVAQTVSRVTGTDDAEAAQARIKQDPAMAADLKLKLAQIAVDEEDRKRKDELAQLQAVLQAEDQKRQAEFSSLQAKLKADAEN